MKALIAMSGGVDSSVAAYLVQRQGYDCIGCTMKLYESEAGQHGCCTLEDVEDARAVAFRLGMPYYVFNYVERFREKVIGKFISCYERGLTPNPCIDCNRYMKFDALYERARVLGCDRIVTGHYARIEQEDGKYVLKKALWTEKDQSYVLYAMTQEQLAHTLFPLGALRKAETRAIAAAQGFVNAEKPDSQDICFVPDGDYARVIEEYTGKPCLPGRFLSTDGADLGEHKGVIRYTVGQRRGLGVAAGAPLYVCAIDAPNNRVILGPNEALFSDTALVRDFRWISGEAPKSDLRCQVKIRYRQREQPATLHPLPDGGARIVFDAPQRAVTPGQAAVAYDGDTVLGGGEIVHP